ncbi:hypothetical protein K438DRAFT_2061248 [Mycena galopus ATCC 62051]|nr:hypothetical protein K438DRAFT_2061248 [Mycena galopus ATCC 62051]
MRSAILPLGVLLAIVAPVPVSGKSKGKSSSTGSKSTGDSSEESGGDSSEESSNTGTTQKSSSSRQVHSSLPQVELSDATFSSTTSSSSGGTHVIIVTTNGNTVCYNENNQIIPCPPNSARKNLIIGAVIGGIFGAILLGLLAYFITIRCKQRRRLRANSNLKKSILPSFGKQEYKPLHDESDDL